jgi:hypothetical protein
MVSPVRFPRGPRQTDFFGNPPALTGGFQLGVSSYF